MATQHRQQQQQQHHPRVTCPPPTPVTALAQVISTCLPHLPIFIICCSTRPQGQRPTAQSSRTRSSCSWTPAATLPPVLTPTTTPRSSATSLLDFPAPDLPGLHRKSSITSPNWAGCKHPGLPNRAGPGLWSVPGPSLSLHGGAAGEVCRQTRSANSRGVSSCPAASISIACFATSWCCVCLNVVVQQVQQRDVYAAVSAPLVTVRTGPYRPWLFVCPWDDSLQSALLGSNGSASVHLSQSYHVR
jgi:hypothetical protein